MGALFGFMCIIFFSLVNHLLWGDYGKDVHLLNNAVPVYPLTWLWIALISIIWGFSYACDGKEKHHIGCIISIWWMANISMTTLLNWIFPRDVEAQSIVVINVPDWMSSVGLSSMEMSSIAMDVVGQSPVDVIALLVLYKSITKGRVVASVWVVIFGFYLVANLSGHFIASYRLLIGQDADATAYLYDSYLYLIFTIMLLVQFIGAGLDAMLRWSKSNVDIYRDIRPFFARIAHRHLHLS